MTEKSVLILGGGLGGLMTGAFLAKEGYQVTVLEKNTTAGGGLQTFRRGNIDYVTGMHLLGGCYPGGILQRLFRYLEIEEQISIRDVDPENASEIYIASDKHTYRIASGREGFVNSLATDFPNERENLKRYVDKLYSITDTFVHFNLLPTEDSFSIFHDEYLIPTDSFIAQYIQDPKLRSILLYMSSLYDTRAGRVPIYIHALVNVFYINGISRFVGGSAQLAQALTSVITANGGSVRVNTEVNHIAVKDKEIVHVESTDGRVFRASHYISAFHTHELLRVIDPEAFSKVFRNRILALPHTYSVFFVFIEFRPNSFQNLNRTCFYMSDYDKLWCLDQYSDEWPNGFLYMTPPDTNSDDRWATHMVVNAVMPYSAVKQWENTSTGHRGKEYEDWKNAHVERILTRLEEIFPDIRSAIREIHSASPLTVRDYYHSPEGSVYGYAKDSSNIYRSQISIFTKVRNLFLTGQCIRLHGCCGVPLTAISTAEALVGRNKIIEKL